MCRCTLLHVLIRAFRALACKCRTPCTTLVHLDAGAQVLSSGKSRRIVSWRIRGVTLIQCIIIMHIITLALVASNTELALTSIKSSTIVYIKHFHKK
jgi:hypothetical protein